MFSVFTFLMIFLSGLSFQSAEARSIGRCSNAYANQYFTYPRPRFYARRFAYTPMYTGQRRCFNINPYYGVTGIPIMPVMPAFPVMPAYPAMPAFPAMPALPAAPALPMMPAYPAMPLYSGYGNSLFTPYSNPYSVPSMGFTPYSAPYFGLPSY
jgi:hypothetical protein